MNILSTRTICGAGLLTAICFLLSSAGAQTTTTRIVTAANVFLSTLDARQRQSVQFAYDDEKQRVRWSNLPTSMVPRAGLKLGDLNVNQRSAALALLAAALSPRGFEKVQQIMEGDEMLKNNEPSGNRGGRGPGGGLMFGKDLYYISILGTPAAGSPWMLQFGGHHLALNITVAGERGILTPTLTGAQPALYTANGKTVRPLGRESDKALALLKALDDAQRKQAILNYRVGDLVLGPGQDGKTIQPEGLKASAMNERQRTMLLDVISEWTGIIHESAAGRLEWPNSRPTSTTHLVRVERFDNSGPGNQYQRLLPDPGSASGN